MKSSIDQYISAWRLILLLACTLFQFKFKHILHIYLYSIFAFNLAAPHPLSLAHPRPPAWSPPFNITNNTLLLLLRAPLFTQILQVFFHNVDIILRFQSLVFLPTCVAWCALLRFHTSNQRKYTVRFTNLHIHSLFVFFFFTFLLALLLLVPRSFAFPPHFCAFFNLWFP